MISIFRQNGKGRGSSMLVLHRLNVKKKPKKTVARIRKRLVVKKKTTVRKPAGKAAKPRKNTMEPAPFKASASVRGVNLIGFIRAETGIGESVRLAAKALLNTDIPFGIVNYPAHHDVRMEDMTWAYKEMPRVEYNVNIFHINGDMTKEAAGHFGGRATRGKYNIGFWHWELPEYPHTYCRGFDVVQEVWAPSTFVMDSISMKSKVPVVRIPHGIEVSVPPGMNRDSLGLPHDRFLFCAMSDTQSYQKRKNPLGAVDAFKRAFDANDPHVGLVIKVNNADSRPAEMNALRGAIGGHSNIYIIDRTFSREEVNGLLNSIDGFISLHRSEGFGLPLAEAMYLGKPAVGTNWSGNTDFMNPGNSCAVNYKLVEVGEYWGPYEAHQIWAEPDIDHAVQCLRRLVEHPEWRSMIAEAGRHTIHTRFSPFRTGQLIKKRLQHLGLIKTVHK